MRRVAAPSLRGRAPRHQPALWQWGGGPWPPDCLLGWVYRCCGLTQEGHQPGILLTLGLAGVWNITGTVGPPRMAVGGQVTCRHLNPSPQPA